MLAVMKIGAVIVPTATAAGAADLADRVARSGARAVVTTPDQTAKFAELDAALVRVSVGATDGLGRPARRVRRRRRAAAAPGHRAGRPAAPLLHLRHDRPAQARRAHPGVVPRRPPLDRLLARPAPGDRHLNLSSPGWAKHAWSCFFAPVDRGVDDRGAVATRGSTPAALLDVLREQRGHQLLRPADGVADAHQRRPVRRPGRAARGGRRGRAAQPRGHRAGAPRAGGWTCATATARPR